MEGVSGDLQVKYQKLAVEYSKIRAQANVLKKAIVDEQARNGELRDILKEKEQSLRKADQEMDSLTFRNQQLTKRVTVLQEELDVLQSRHKKGKNKSGDNNQGSDIGNHIIDEEFHKTVHENARLLSLMNDKDAAHEEELSALKQRFQNLEHELHQRHAVNSDAEIKYKAVIDQLQEEKQCLCENAESQAHEFEKISQEFKLLQQQHSQIKGELGGQLDSAHSIISHHLPFVDSKNSELNELNVPLHDRKHQLYAFHVIAQAGLHVKDLTAALSDFHTYTEQRLHCTTSGDLSPINIKFSGHLKENAKYLRAMEQGYQEFQDGVESDGLTFLETLPSLRKLSSQLSVYANYLCKLRQYYLLSVNEENSQLTCTEGLEVCNREVAQHFIALTNHFMKLSTYVQLLSAQSRRTCQHPPSSQRRFLLEVTEILKGMHETVKDLSRAYNTKSNLEHELPTSAERLLNTDECLVKSLTAMVAASSKLAGVLSDSRAELWKFLGPSVVNNPRTRNHPVVMTFKKRAASYINCLEQEEPSFVSYEEALKEREEARSNAVNNESLTEQLTQCRERATKLEKEREHWCLEYHLLQLSHRKKIKDLEEHLQSLSDTSTPHSTDGLGDESVKNHSVGPTNITNLLGHLEAPLTLRTEMEAREQEVKNYFLGRINELVAACQEAESKCAALTAECQVLQTRLQLNLQGKQQIEMSLQEAQDSLTRLQDELHTTSQNYEAQLSIMSEHLANMNDKLTVQCDEIDQLKYQLSNKASRKGKQK